MGIVERLRKLKWMLNCEVRGMIPDTTAYEAADHIEALEASVVGLTQERDFHRETADIHAERIALIERLREALERIAHGDRWTDPDSPERIARDAISLIKEIEGE